VIKSEEGSNLWVKTKFKLFGPILDPAKALPILKGNKNVKDFTFTTADIETATSYKRETYRT
jgi:hypothetical protein